MRTRAVALSIGLLAALGAAAGRSPTAYASGEGPDGPVRPEPATETGRERRVVVVLVAPERFEPSGGQRLDLALPPFGAASLPPGLAEAGDRVERRLEAARPGTVVRRFRHLPLLALTASPDQLEVLRQSPDVVTVADDRADRPLLESSLPFIHAPAMQAQGWLGEGTAVAVLDSPVRYWNGHFGDCPEPGAPGCSIVAWENFTDDPIMSVAEGEGHGTNVAGIVLGTAPAARIISLNVFHWNKAAGDWRAYVSDQIAAIDWVLEHRQEFGIVAVNMSLGSERNDPRPCNFDAMYQPFLRLWEAGIVTAVSSGNDGSRIALGSPACVTLAFSVGAQFDTDLLMFPGLSCTHLEPSLGEIACFSNLNGALDLVAPGAFVNAGGLAHYGGTSMSAPHVAGAAALLQSGWRAAGTTGSAAQVGLALQLLATPLPHQGYPYKQLNLDDSLAPGWSYGYLTGSFPREEDRALIPPGPDGYLSEAEMQLIPDGTTAGGLYLHLELIHPAPGDLALTVTAPDGRSVATRLPAGQANFNAILGRHIDPGLFAPLAGSPLGGRWTARIVDTGPEGNRGWFVQAAFLFQGSGCRPTCGGRTCGDDLCGGQCGECPEGWYCSSAGECVANGDLCRGDSCATAIPIPAASGTYADSTLDCRSDERGSCGGSIVGEVVFAFEIERPTIFSARADGFPAAIYLKRGACGIETELACGRGRPTEPPEPAVLEQRTLEPDLYHLYVDGNYERGDFSLHVDMCTPDCRQRACGGDGCGGECGTCGPREGCDGETGLCRCLFADCDGGCCPEGRVCNPDGGCACPAAECAGVCCASGEVCGHDGGCRSPSAPAGCGAGEPIRWLLLLALLPALGPGMRARRAGDGEG